MMRGIDRTGQPYGPLPAPADVLAYVKVVGYPYFPGGVSGHLEAAVAVGSEKDENSVRRDEGGFVVIRRVDLGDGARFAPRPSFFPADVNVLVGLARALGVEHHGIPVGGERRREIVKRGINRGAHVDDVLHLERKNLCEENRGNGYRQCRCGC